MQTPLLQSKVRKFTWQGFFLWFTLCGAILLISLKWFISDVIPFSREDSVATKKDQSPQLEASKASSTQQTSPQSQPPTQSEFMCSQTGYMELMQQIEKDFPNKLNTDVTKGLWPQVVFHATPYLQKFGTEEAAINDWFTKYPISTTLGGIRTYGPGFYTVEFDNLGLAIESHTKAIIDGKDMKGNGFLLAVEVSEGCYSNGVCQAWRASNVDEFPGDRIEERLPFCTEDDEKGAKTDLAEQLAFNQGDHSGGPYMKLTKPGADGIRPVATECSDTKTVDGDVHVRYKKCQVDDYLYSDPIGLLKFDFTAEDNPCWQHVNTDRSIQTQN